MSVCHQQDHHTECADEAHEANLAGTLGLGTNDHAVADVGAGETPLSCADIVRCSSYPRRTLTRFVPQIRGLSPQLRGRRTLCAIGTMGSTVARGDGACLLGRAGSPRRWGRKTLRVVRAVVASIVSKYATTGWTLGGATISETGLPVTVLSASEAGICLPASLSGDSSQASTVNPRSSRSISSSRTALCFFALRRAPSW